jgi:hypothetical protein
MSGKKTKKKARPGLVDLGGKNVTKIASKQGKWTEAQIKEKLDGFKTISFEKLVKDKDKYIGTLVRYFRNGKFRTGGVLNTVEITKVGPPPEGYAGFVAIMPRVRWTTQSKESVFWVQKTPSRVGRKKGTKNGQSAGTTSTTGKKAKMTMDDLTKDVNKKWFSTPASLTGDSEKVYVAYDSNTKKVHTSDKADGLTVPEAGKISSRVVYGKVREGNNKLYKRRFLISRLNDKTLKELKEFLKGK